MKRPSFKFSVRTLVFTISLIAIVVSGTYAYFSVTTNYATPKEERTTYVTTDYLEVDFVTNEYINNTSLMLIKNEEVSSKADKTTFSISKKDGADYTIKYNIYLTELNISDNLKSADFKWDLLQNGVSIYSNNFSNAESLENYMLSAEPLVLNDDSASYEFRIWLEESSQDQIELLNGEFSAKIAIDVYTVVRTN